MDYGKKYEGRPVIRLTSTIPSETAFFLIFYPRPVLPTAEQS